MSEPQPSNDDELVSAMLAADERTLANGTSTDGPQLPTVRPELADRLEGNLACIDLLRRWLPQRGASGVEDPLAHDHGFPHLGRFDVEHELGRGAFGIVYLAYDRDLERAVALKVPRPEVLVTAELRERFLQEARIAAGLDHPNLVQVYEVEAHGPVCYIVSAYCPGITLAAWLKEFDQPVPARQAAQLVTVLTAAVAYAHGCGVIHRDLKPSNILLQNFADDNKQPQTVCGRTIGLSAAATAEPALPLNSYLPRITDFGLAKIIFDVYSEMEAGQPLPTQTGTLLGTPEYMAPEQASRQHRDVGPGADVYALGTILYELLSGRLPFRGETKLDTLEMVRTQDPLPLRQLVPGLPRDLEIICHKCLEKNPLRRYASAESLAEDLRLFLDGAPIRARAVGITERCIRQARKHPGVAAGIGVSVLAATALLVVVGLYNAHLSSKNRELAHALSAADASRRQADENLELARKGVYNFATRQADSPDVRLHSLEIVRGLILSAAIEFYDELARRRPDDPDLKSERGAVYLQLGRVKMEMHYVQESLPFFETAESILRQVVADEPQSPDHRSRLTRLCLNLGRAHYWIGDYELREKYTREAVRLAEELINAESPSDEKRIVLGQSYNSLTAMYLDFDDEKQAEPAARAALKYAEALAAAHPQSALSWGVLIESLNNLGVVSLRVGRLDEAEAAIRRACDLGEPLVLNLPSYEEYRLRLARSYVHLGDACALGGRSDVAERAYLQGRDLLVQQNVRHADRLDLHDDLSIALHNLSVFYAETGRPVPAKAAHEWALPIMYDKAGAFRNLPDYIAHQAVRRLADGIRIDETGSKPPLPEEVQAIVAQLRETADQGRRLPSCRGALARAANNLGISLLDAGQSERAAVAFEEARTIAEELVAAHPATIDYAIDLSVIYHNLGRLAWGRGNSREALDWHSRGVDLLETRLQPLPQRSVAWRFLGIAHAARAAMFAHLDRPDDMRLDLVALTKQDFPPLGDAIHLHRAWLLTTPRLEPAPDPLTSASSNLTAELPVNCRRLGYIYLFDRLQFRQPAPLF